MDWKLQVARPYSRMMLNKTNYGKESWKKRNKLCDSKGGGGGGRRRDDNFFDFFIVR